jgi:phytoene dehydrogenase-like protein
MNQEFDAIIVGAGHNGLTAGCYLSMAGRRVAIVERMSKIGGMTSSGYMMPEAPQHLTTPCAVEVIFMRSSGVIEELELGQHGYRTVDPDPSYAYLHPDGTSIALFRDAKRTAEDIARLSRADGAAYLEFMKVVDALLDFALPIMASEPGKPSLRSIGRLIGAGIRNLKLRNELTAITHATTDQVACERFEHPASIAFLTGIAAGAGPIDEDGNAAAYALFGALHRIGVGRPIGSMQTVSGALASKFAALGGTVVLNAPVAEILIFDGQARGLRLEDGRVLRSKVVIASCDPRTAFKLVTPGGIPRRLMQSMEHAPANRANAAPLLANIAMSRPFQLRRHQQLRHDDANLNQAVGMIGLPEDVRESFAAARRGDVPSRHALSVSPLSNWDPSQAPAGQSLAYIYLPAIAVQARGGWTRELKDSTMKSIMAIVAEYYEGTESEVGRFVETPLDRAARLNVTNGCVTHIDFGSHRTGLQRPASGLGGPEPIVPGFFLGSAGIHPGGGVSGVAGKIAAARAQRYLKKVKN